MRKIISGYASIFDVEDLQGDVILQGAFGQNIVYTKVPLLWQHDKNKSIGYVFQMHQDHYGLFVQAEIDITIPFNTNILYQIQNGVAAFSIGYNVINEVTDEETGTRYLEDIDLTEVSIVTKPANVNAGIISIQ